MNETPRILFFGARTWEDSDTIEDWITLLPREAIVVHGAAKGADQAAASIALARGLTVRGYPADWNQHGKAAGPRRNQAMLDAEHPHVAVGFTDTILRGACSCGRGVRLTGSGDMAARALSSGVRVTLVPSAAARIQARNLDQTASAVPEDWWL